MTHLRAYLDTNGVRQTTLADQLGVSRSYVSELVGGTKTPSLEVAVAIERITSGAITAVSWVPDVAPSAGPATDQEVAA